MMEYINRIKAAMRTWLMQRQLSRRARSRMVMGMEEARSVGIIFDANTAADYRLVMNYVKLIQDMGKKVKCLGYYQAKKKPGYLNDHVNWTYCQPSDFAWNLNVKSEAVLNFLNERLDLLIDLSPSAGFYPKFLAGMSLALYKVGRYDPGQIEVFDLFMNVSEQIKLQELMDHVNHYLAIIKKPQVDAKPV